MIGAIRLGRAKASSMAAFLQELGKVAQRMYRTGGGFSGNQKVFSREADGKFDDVPEEKIAKWREKLNARFGIGEGRLVPIEEPAGLD